MILVTIASMPTSSEGMTEFQPAHFALLKQKCLLTLTVGKKIYAVESKQTSTLLEIQNSNKSSFEILLNRVLS